MRGFLLPVVMLFLFIAVAVTLHSESPDLERVQEVACEAELPSAVEVADSVIELHAHTYHYDIGTAAIHEADRMHVVQNRQIIAGDQANFRNYYMSVPPRHRDLSREAVGGAGVCSVSHHSPIIAEFDETRLGAMDSLAGRA